jgi:hypothetical protein
LPFIIAEEFASLAPSRSWLAAGNNPRTIAVIDVVIRVELQRRFIRSASDKQIDRDGLPASHWREAAILGDRESFPEEQLPEAM